MTSVSRVAGGGLQERTMPVIWAAFAGTQLMLAVLGWVLWTGPDPDASITVWILVATVVPLTVLATVGARRVIPDGPGAGRTRSFIRWAAAEAITMMGFVGTMVGGPRWLVLVHAAWGFSLILLSYPSSEAAE